jgi:hypothetical protein
MPALLLTLAVFAIWWLVGMALLASVGADTGSLRIALTAPALGACGVLVPTFTRSNGGRAVEHFATPLTIGLVAAAAAVVAAYSVVPRDVRPYAIVAGVPASERKRRFTDEQIEALLEIAWWDWPMERILASVPILCDGRIEKFIADAQSVAGPMHGAD